MGIAPAFAITTTENGVLRTRASELDTLGLGFLAFLWPSVFFSGPRNPHLEYGFWRGLSEMMCVHFLTQCLAPRRVQSVSDSCHSGICRAISLSTQSITGIIINMPHRMGRFGVLGHLVLFFCLFLQAGLLRAFCRLTHVALPWSTSLYIAFFDAI